MLGAPRKSPASGAVLTDHSPPCMRRRVCRLWGWRWNIGIHRWLRRLAGYVCHASHRVHLSPDWVLRRPTLAAAMCQAPASCLPCCNNCGTGPRIRRPRGYCHRCDNCRATGPYCLHAGHGMCHAIVQHESVHSQRCPTPSHRARNGHDPNATRHHRPLLRP